MLRYCPWKALGEATLSHWRAFSSYPHRCLVSGSSLTWEKRSLFLRREYLSVTLYEEWWSVPWWPLPYIWGQSHHPPCSRPSSQPRGHWQCSSWRFCSARPGAGLDWISLTILLCKRLRTAFLTLAVWTAIARPWNKKKTGIEEPHNRMALHIAEKYIWKIKCLLCLGFRKRTLWVVGWKNMHACMAVYIHLKNQIC